MNIEKLYKKYSILKKIEKRANYLFKYNYKKYIHANYSSLIIESIMSNGKCRLVAKFKDYLIKDDYYEYLRRFYNYKEINIRIKNLCNYHIKTSIIFPNYFPLIESKYLYNSVIKKQKIIDEQQILEDKKNNNRNKKEENLEILFTNTIYEDIFNSSESVMRIIFGLEKNKVNLKNYTSKNTNNKGLNELINSEENKLDINKDISDLNKIIKQIDQVEQTIIKNKNINQNIDDFNSNNKNIKINQRLKLVAKDLNYSLIKNKNQYLFNNITNSSTNNTNSSNNIKSNINSKNNINNMFINKIDKSIFITNNKIKINQNIINTIKKNKKNNNRPTPYQTSYGLNFILKNPLINNLINVDKKKKNKNNNINWSKNYNNYFNNFNKNSLINNRENFNLTIKQNKIKNFSQKKIPKIEISKLNTINNNILTIVYRNRSRNFNKLFKGLTATKSKSCIKKSKNIIRNTINPSLSLSPLNKKLKNIFRKQNNNKYLYNSKESGNLKCISYKRHNNQYFSYENLKKSKKKLSIKEYNSKKNS